MTTKSSLLIFGLALGLMAGCGGKAAKNKNTAETNAKDITLPPQMIKQTQPAEQEGNPDETVSSEELRKSRAEEVGGKSDE